MTIKDFFNRYLKINVSFLKDSEFIFEKQNRFEYQKKCINFDVKKDEKVLDIGSGHDPFVLATHLADFFESDNVHRARPLKKDFRPFTVCNVEEIPFEDHEFDFVYCSHVLEHVNNPALACEEIMRIGKRGYIETPTRLSDTMLNFISINKMHKWHIIMLKSSLVFCEYQKWEQKNTGVDYFFNQLQSEYTNDFQTLYFKNINLFNNMFLWKGKFIYYVFDKSGKLIRTNE